jgi:hypothetical protein
MSRDYANMPKHFAKIQVAIDEYCYGRDRQIRQICITKSSTRVDMRSRAGIVSAALRLPPSSRARLPNEEAIQCL